MERGGDAAALREQQAIQKGDSPHAVRAAAFNKVTHRMRAAAFKTCHAWCCIQKGGSPHAVRAAACLA